MAVVLFSLLLLSLLSMPLQPIEQVEFGGVDSRSNPINMPENRLLRCLNWVPKEAGQLEQRWGYSTVTMSAVTSTAISGLIPYRTWTGQNYVLIFQGTTWNQLAVATGTVTTPTVRGAAIAGSGRGNSYLYSNRLHYGNGVDQKVFDGSVWRDNGIRIPTAGEGAAVTVSAGTVDANGLAPAILSGYQFYMAYYNPTTGHAGNRIAIGARLANTASTIDVGFVGLPQMSTVGGNNSAGDSEWQILLGRTGDGAQVPYACVDTGNNFITVPNTATAFTLTTGLIDGNHELPIDNGVIPRLQTMFAVVGDYIMSCDQSSPTVRVSGSQLDANTGIFTGLPEQSWSPSNIETFPTSGAVRCLAEVDLQAFVATLADCALLSDLAGVRTWIGPWPIGCAGSRAKVKTHHGFFWLTAEKQLATLSNGLPMIVSEEYEAAELSQISELFLFNTELVYFRDQALGKDEIRIEGQKADGSPYTVIHDFRLMDSRSPLGQGYSAKFSGPLATVFVSAQVRDATSKLKIFAGASTGRLYEQYSGADDVGNQFASDAIGLVNVGPDRPSVQSIDWYGDSNVVMSIGKTLNTDLASDQFVFAILPTAGVQGYENDFRYRAKLPAPELRHTYLRFQLTSHSADGSLALNSPPHLPLENYGRIYELMPIVGDTRGV